MVDPSLIDFLNVFLTITLTHLLYRFFKDMKSLWWLILCFTCLFFRLESVVCKKYTNANGMDSNYTNAMDKSIIWSCGGGGVCSAGSFIACIGSMAGSFIDCVGSISAFFLHHLKYFPSTCSCIFLCPCVLPQHVLGPLWLFLMFFPCFILSKTEKIQ